MVVYSRWFVESSGFSRILIICYLFLLYEQSIFYIFKLSLYEHLIFVITAHICGGVMFSAFVCDRSGCNF